MTKSKMINKLFKKMKKKRDNGKFTGYDKLFGYIEELEKNFNDELYKKYKKYQKSEVFFYEELKYMKKKKKKLFKDTDFNTDEQNEIINEVHEKIQDDK